LAEKTTNEEMSKVGVESEADSSEQPERRARGGRRQQRARGEASVNMDQLREIIALVRENALAEFELEQEGFHVRLRREEAPREAGSESRASGHTASHFEAVAASSSRSSAASHASSSGTPTHPGASAESAALEDQDLHIITSPIVGTFYRSASPTAEVFVKIGSNVEQETVVCIIEAMKLMNEILAETTGEVAKIYVENGQPVEYGQPLFGIKR
jgi:acetyl-CoA carboxylase biotin carboxyl carrier protein